MFDKVLLIILILLLPVGIIASRQFGGQLGFKNADQSETQIKKIEDLLTQLNDKAGQAAEEPAVNQKIVITGVISASESGIIKIAGNAPLANQILWINYTVADNKEEIPEIQSTKTKIKVKSEVIQTAVKPQTDGSFVIELPIIAKTGILYTLIQQGSNSYSVSYDLGLQKQLNETGQ
jgi:hypothetical protein